MAWKITSPPAVVFPALHLKKPVASGAEAPMNGKPSST